jgi:probable addiction module antidote protein
MTTRKAAKPRGVEYKMILARELRDPELAAGYLTEAFAEGEEVFLLALKDVVEARGGMRVLAERTRLNREGLYDMLSRRGNPRLSSLVNILAGLGLGVRFAPASGRAAA